MVKDLLVFKTVKASVVYTFLHWKLLLIAALPWLAIYALFTMFFQLLGVVEYLELSKALKAAVKLGDDDLISQLNFKIEPLKTILGSWLLAYNVSEKILYVVTFSGVAVMWFRNYFLAETSPKMRFGIIELRVILYFGTFMIILSIVMLIVGIYARGITQNNAIFGMNFIITGFILLFIAARFLLMFPSIAVGDKRMNLKMSWRITKGNGWPLYGGVLLLIIICVPIFILKYFLNGLGLFAAIEWPLHLFLWLVCLVLFLSFLSNVYQFFVPSPNMGDLE